MFCELAVDVELGERDGDLVRRGDGEKQGEDKRRGEREGEREGENVFLPLILYVFRKKKWFDLLGFRLSIICCDKR